MTETSKEADNGVDRDYLTDFLSRAIAFPTPVTDAGETDNQVLAFLEELLATELERLRFDFVDFDEMGNLCGRVDGLNRGRPPLVLVGFAMTHPAASMAQAYNPRVIDGSEFGEEGSVVVGRGAGEQKGPLASVVAAFEALRRSGTKPDGDVYLLGLASGETGRHHAIRSAVDHFRLEPAGAVVAVCTGNDIVVGHKGRVDIKVTVHGKAAHSSSPSLGVNALAGAGAVLQRIAGLDLGTADPDLGSRSVTPVALETRPKATHTIPSQAELLVDWRLLPGDTPDWAVSRLIEALAGLEPYDIEVEAGDLMYPSEVPKDSWLVEALSASVERVTGSPPDLLRISAATDSGYLNNHGVPAVLFGPGDLAKAHTDADYVSLDEAVDSARVLADWMSS